MEWLTTNQSKNKNENKKGKCSGTCGPQNKLFRKKFWLSAKSNHQKNLKSSNSQNVQNLAGLVVLRYYSLVLPVYKDKPRVRIAVLKRSIKY